MTELHARTSGVIVRPYGENAFVLELGDAVDEVTHERVLALDVMLRDALDDGRLGPVEEVVPSYRSVLLRLRDRPPDVSTADVQAEVLALLAGGLTSRTTAPRRHDVPVDLDAAAAADLPEVARRTGCTVDEVVALLTGCDLRVYLHGFAPGFTYLGGVPEPLHLPRRTSPREPVPAGSVLLAAGQAALCPSPMPTGWWVVGRTSLSLFDPVEPPHVPFVAGDSVRLVPS